MDSEHGHFLFSHNNFSEIEGCGIYMTNGLAVNYEEDITNQGEAG